MCNPIHSVGVTRHFGWKKQQQCAWWTWKWVKSSQHKMYESKPTRIPLLFVRTNYEEEGVVNAAFSRSANMRFKMNAYTRKYLPTRGFIDFCVHVMMLELNKRRIWCEFSSKLRERSAPKLETIFSIHKTNYFVNNWNKYENNHNLKKTFFF